ncbi:hypothetical protein OG2516_16681 [Oceanicola granulosus HTCC2516]|uniref:Uncharacterized protein n=1 Tax=Oceanicola granulosus (strain ATCC BAA-861 / DSM 15982 / KCTC 12143 / HTCC2516) TaxID=314256 RepID=Q2CCE7_OCEGH|nr:DUF6173 family protein [Oceanicola granulosus]EAR50371.1 hypothetical protein OG2516_16681 [Oceanicola granulosus HTCC2516]
MTDSTIATAAEAEEADALPRVHEVHADPETGQIKVPEGLGRKAPKRSPARWAYERLILYIQNFEKQLDADHEVAMGFTGGDAGVIRIEGMGYFDPDIVTFYGRDPGGAKTQMIQHVSQLNVLLRALPKHIDQPKPNRIGFRLARDLEEVEEDDEADPPPAAS